jgi:hypothetical protein
MGLWIELIKSIKICACGRWEVFFLGGGFTERQLTASACFCIRGRDESFRRVNKTASWIFCYSFLYLISRRDRKISKSDH